MDDLELVSVRTAKSGIFEPLVKTGQEVPIGQPMAHIINAYDGEVLETLYVPVKGMVFFMHTDPLTYADTAVIKIARI